MAPRSFAQCALALVLLVAVASAPAAHGDSAGPFLYTDARGSTHMVQTWDEIPASARSSARTLGGDKVEYQSRVSDMTPARAKRAKKTARRMQAVPERQRDAVIFYTASWCGACKRVRQYLTQQRIPFDARDVDDPAVARELRRTTGSTMVPVVRHENRVVVGWNPRAIDALGL